MIPSKYIEKGRRIRDWFNPKQRWLTNKIPNHWVDKDILWEICILEGIKHFVEEEQAFQVLSSDNPPEQAKFMSELKENYRLVKEVIPSLERGLELAWENVPKRDWNMINSGTDYDLTYGEINRLEELISDTKTKVMFWAVSNRAWIWT